MDTAEMKRVIDVFDDVRSALEERHGVMGALAVKRFNETLRRFESDARRTAFDHGFQLAAKVEQQAAREALQQYALVVLGKDRGDGAVNLGILGEDVIADA